MPKRWSDVLQSLRVSLRVTLCLSRCLVAFTAACGFLGQRAAAQELPRNIALGKPYTLSPAPNYQHCTDPDDAIQLTDGQYVEGYFWTQKGTVGWAGGGRKFITLDLGEVRPISGISFDTAAGVAEVGWPASILIYLSDDGQLWHCVGDLMEMVSRETLPPYGEYARRKLTAMGWRVHGRYVQLAVELGGWYGFVDEIEVYEGEAAALGEPLPGEPVEDVPAHLTLMAFNALLREQLRRDLQAVREDIQAPGVEEQQRRELSARAEAIAQRIGQAPLVRPEGFRAVLPMTDLEREIFALQAEVWRAQGKPLLRVWHCHRYDHLSPSAEPGDGEKTADGAKAGDAAERYTSAQPARISVRMMNGEVRADVVNFTNAASQPAQLRLRIEGLPGGVNPDYVTVHEVLHVGTRNFDRGTVAAALVEAQRDGEGWTITVPSGMTSQAWVEFKPRTAPAGEHTGRLVVQPASGQPVNVPLQLIISPIKFPTEQTLLVGGWCYTDGAGAYGVTPQNREAFISFLREHGVNAPWATSAAMPEGEYDADGNMTRQPDTARFDEWVSKWPDARLYMVFLAKGDSIAGHKMGTPSFEKAVGQWARFWADHVRTLGLKPSQVGFLVYDEPSDATGYAINEAWARAIHAAEPDFKLFVDPIPRSPEGMDSMIDAMDILCPNRIIWLEQDWMSSYYAAQREKGKELWFYSCSGPTRSFDPYSYYLLQAWHAFAVGATGSCFWAFGDTGGVSPWNDYVGAGAGPYCPLYLDETSVTSAKWMEAIREGIQDYEYLTMLRRWVDDHVVEATGRPARALSVLGAAVKQVLATQEGTNFRWDRAVDRATADRARAQVLDALEALAF
ncbi:MAG: hypothetical protein N2512_10195 [Armatimonadetes bacterium]|nr:hypothetical protein [Armatimonadota bacterium]